MRSISSRATAAQQGRRVRRLRSRGALRAVEDLRQSLDAVGVATIGPQISLTLAPSFWTAASFVPAARHAPDLHALLDQVITWARALRTVRIAVGQKRDTTASLRWSRLEDMRFRPQ
jgi:hypothetical protein